MWFDDAAHYIAGAALLVIILSIAFIAAVAMVSVAVAVGRHAFTPAKGDSDE